MGCLTAARSDTQGAAAEEGGGAAGRQVGPRRRADGEGGPGAPGEAGAEPDGAHDQGPREEGAPMVLSVYLLVFSRAHEKSLSSTLGLYSAAGRAWQAQGHC